MADHDVCKQRYERYKGWLYHCEPLGLSLDLSRMKLTQDDLARLQPALASSLSRMAELEKGAIANQDEQRRVGHYWLRAPELAPEPALGEAITAMWEQVESFARQVHQRAIAPATAKAFRNVLLMGIGGSALGPQLLSDALGTRDDKLRLWFLDNTDPDGIDRVLAQIEPRTGLDATLCVIVSKSGGTKETRNCMLEVAAAYAQAGLDFGTHAVAITGVGSKLDQLAVKKGFLARLPMWDWVGGRTSVTAAVGLLPAALQGLDFRQLIAGARQMDELTRSAELRQNPAALLAAAWHQAAGGRGLKDMVVIPYKDRLQLLSRYLQQLVMESLGKRHDLDGREVNQGLAVYGNKGSTDQHAYVQQLLDGLDNFFVTFIEVLRERQNQTGSVPIQVEPGITTGDYLAGFLLGTRRALSDRGRESLTITIEDLDARRLGALIALYERAVGLYANLVNINAYHQPAVESGKRAAAEVLELQRQLVTLLRQQPGRALTVAELCAAAGSGDPETVLLILRRLSANPHSRIVRRLAASAPPWEATFEAVR